MPIGNRISLTVTEDHRFRAIVHTPIALLRIVERWVRRAKNDTAKAPKPLPHLLEYVAETGDTIHDAVDRALLRFAEECLRLPDDDAIELDLTEAKVTIARLENELKTARELNEAQRATIQNVMNDRENARRALDRSYATLQTVRECTAEAYRRINKKRLCKSIQVAVARDQMSLAIQTIDDN